jgi:hypothetical protein
MQLLLVGTLTALIVLSPSLTAQTADAKSQTASTATKSVHDLYVEDQEDTRTIKDTVCARPGRVRRTRSATGPATTQLPVSYLVKPLLFWTSACSFTPVVTNDGYEDKIEAAQTPEERLSPG